jgi:hypothetical protein
VIEDVLVKIDSLVIPCDFYILDMEHDSCDSSTSTPILFGRPFLKTANAKIDCGKDTLSMEVGDEKIEFNFHDAMKYPYSNVYSITCYDQIDKCVQQVCDFDCEDGLSIALSYGYDFTKIEEMERHVCVPQNVHESVLALQALQTVPHGNLFVDLVLSHKKLLPSILQAPELELKPLPDNLKYVFIGDNNTLPVIIAKGLTNMQEEKLVKLLCDHKTAIGWTLADIKGISPSMCMHHILLEDNAKPTREMQRRLNPPMMEVVKAEILKLLDAGVIYPITDSKWVAPIHVVPKKTGITLVKNKNDELIPTRISSGWRMCVDYRKLNLSTRKDHFPLPFMDQMLERLAGKSFYCFLDGYSGYNQIVINPEDQEKTTFTCPFGTYAYRRMPFGLCNAPATFQRCMMSIFSDYVERIIEVFMDDFTVYGDSFDKCLENLSLILKRCIETNLVLNYEKCYFMVEQGIVLGHVVSSRGLEVDKAKIDVISSLPYPSCVREVRSFLGHAGFYRRFIKDFSKIIAPLCRLLAKEVDLCLIKHVKMPMMSLRDVSHLPLSSNHQIGMNLLR